MLQAQPTGEGELRSSKHVYWTDDEIQAGKWIVLPNLRVARLHHLSGDRRVFITTDGKLVCEHGECSSSICSWLSAEQRARKEGVELPQRNSVCDCENTDGLHWTKAMPQEAVGVLPADSFAGLLATLGTERVTARGRVLRHVPHTSLFLSEKEGMFCCRHGNSLSVLRLIHSGASRKFRGGVCKCCVSAPPRRLGLMRLKK